MSADKVFHLVSTICYVIAILCSFHVVSASLRAVGGVGVHDGATTFDHNRELKNRKACLSQVSVWMDASEGLLAFGASYAYVTDGSERIQLEVPRVTTSAFPSIYGNNSDPSPSLTILLQSGESVQSMQGWYSLSGAQVTINYLNFTVQLQNGSTVAHCVGEQSGWQDSVEGPIFGFWGSHGTHITHIGVYIDQALWSKERLSLLKYPKYGTIGSPFGRLFDSYEFVLHDSVTIDFLSVYHSTDAINGFFVDYYYPHNESSDLEFYGWSSEVYGDIILNISAGDVIARLDLGLSGAHSCITAMHIEVRRGHSLTNEIHEFGGSIESTESVVSFNEPIHGFHGFHDNCISALGVYSILQEQGSCSVNDIHCPAGACGKANVDDQDDVVHVVHSEVAPVSTVWFLAVGCFVASLILMVILPAVGSVAVYRRERRALVFPVQN